MKTITKPTIEEQIENTKKEIERCERILAILPQHHGERSFEEYQLHEAEAELQELLTQKGKAKFLKEDVQSLLERIDVRVNGNVVRKVDPESESETPAFQPIVFDVKELEFWGEYIEKSLRFFKNNGRLRMSYKTSDTCYKHFKRRYEQSFNLGYSERLDVWKRIAGEMYCRKQPRMELIVSPEEIENGKVMIQKFER